MATLPHLLQVRIPESLKPLTTEFNDCWGNFVAGLPSMPAPVEGEKTVRANISPGIKTLKSFEDLRKELGMSKNALATAVLAAGAAYRKSLAGKGGNQ